MELSGFEGELEEEQERTAGMDTRHSTISGLEQEQEPATGMDARHGTTSGLEGEQESSDWINRQTKTGSSMKLWSSDITYISKEVQVLFGITKSYVTWNSSQNKHQGGQWSFCFPT